MSKHVHRGTAVRRPLSRGLWLVSCCMVVFYLAASGRALLPGLCATQRALDAQHATGSGTAQLISLRACCALPKNTAPEDREGPTRPVSPGESGCAFCKLVMSVTPVPAHVVLSVPQDPIFGPPLALAMQTPRNGAARPFQNRAPPT